MKKSDEELGRFKYNSIKNYDFKNMTTNQMVQFRLEHKMSVADAEKKIASYKKKHWKTDTEYQKEYLKKIQKPVILKQTTLLTKNHFWNRFKENFMLQNGNEFIVNEQVKNNLAPLFYYFLQDQENFKNCAHVSKITKPCIKKGFLIIGDFGNGKSTTMSAIEKTLRTTPHYFKGYTSNDIVTEYEKCDNPRDRANLINRMSTGRLYFDDMKSERVASNYGKNQIFTEILEKRYTNNAKTYITCNYKKGYEGDLQMAINEFGEKYGDRVNDRMYSMFNIIHFKGKSLRDKF